MTRNDSDRDLDLALEEICSPPIDVRHRVLATDPAERKRVAEQILVPPRRNRISAGSIAVLLVATSAFFGHAWSGDAKTRGRQEQRLQPKSLREVAKLMRSVVHIDLEPLVTFERLQQLPPGPSYRIPADAAKRLRDRIRAQIVRSQEEAVGRRRLVASPMTAAKVVFRLDKGRSVAAEFCCGNRLDFGEAGSITLSRSGASRFHESLREAEFAQRRRVGMVFGSDELQRPADGGFSRSLAQLVCFGLDASDLDRIATFHKLERLDLVASDVAVGPELFQRLSRLRELRSVSVRIESDGRLDPFAGLKELREVRLIGQRGAGLLTKKSCTVCHVAPGSEVKPIAFPALEPLLRLRQLRSLALVAMRLDRQAQAAISMLPRLERLDLSRGDLGALDPHELFPHLRRLRELRLYRCVNLPDGLIASLRKLHRLQRLDLRGITDLDRKSLHALRKALPQCEILVSPK